MKLGTAKKWVVALYETTDKFDPAQFGFTAKGLTYKCPFGVLFDAIAPDCWLISQDGVTLLFDGMQFSVPGDFIKRNKMRTDGYQAMEYFSKLADFSSAAVYVEKNYGAI